MGDSLADVCDFAAGAVLLEKQPQAQKQIPNMLRKVRLDIFIEEFVDCPDTLFSIHQASPVVHPKRVPQPRGSIQPAADLHSTL